MEERAFYNQLESDSRKQFKVCPLCVHIFIFFYMYKCANLRVNIETAAAGVHAWNLINSFLVW